MAFKTDTIKLNTGYTTNPSGVDGQLALVGTPGNRVLKLYDDGSWADVSSGGGGGGGASQLSDLSDVPSAPSSVDTIATVDGSNQLVFQKLTLDNINSANILLGAQPFVASDTVLMTSLAVENKINALGSLTEVSGDTTPVLGGSLDLGGNSITGTGDIDIDGNISANQFIGTLDGSIHFEGQATEPIAKGQAVYVSGLSGNTPMVSLAQANSSSTMNSFGIAANTMALNGVGQIITFGSLTGTDVASWGESGVVFSLGDTIYVSSTEPGRLTNVPPKGESNFIQNLGKIERIDPTTNATIKVGGAGRSNQTPALDNGNIFIGNFQGETITTNLRDTITFYQKNIVQSVNPTADVNLFSHPGSNDIHFVSTADFGAFSLLLEGPGLYGDNVRITIVNASTNTLTVERDQTETWQASIPQLGLTGQTTFDLDSYQKAIVMYTGVADRYDVVILPA